jgi:hypothetical protein
MFGGCKKITEVVWRRKRNVAGDQHLSVARFANIGHDFWDRKVLRRIFRSRGGLLIGAEPHPPLEN